MNDLEKDMEKVEKLKTKKTEANLHCDQKGSILKLPSAHSNLAKSTKNMSLEDQKNKPIMDMHDLISLARKIAKAEKKSSSLSKK